MAKIVIIVPDQFASVVLVFWFFGVRRLDATALQRTKYQVGVGDYFLAPAVDVTVIVIGLEGYTSRMLLARGFFGSRARP